jgi:hypothetical protein
MLIGCLLVRHLQIPREKYGGSYEGKGDDLNELPKDELTKKARELDIHGRSNMNRHQLVRAIRDRENA